MLSSRKSFIFNRTESGIDSPVDQRLVQSTSSKTGPAEMASAEMDNT
jgi:hypothetical protein